MNDALRVLREDVLAFQDVLNRIGDGSLALADYTAYLQTALADILQKIQVLPPSDTRELLLMTWQAVRACPLFAQVAQTNDLPRQLAFLDSALRTCVLAIARSTAPDYLTALLEKMRAGDCIQFNQVFARNIPNADDRTALLEELASTPGVVEHALFDPDETLVFKYARGAAAQGGSIAAALAMLIIVGAATVGICYLGSIVNGWPLSPTSSGSVFIAWLAVLAGVVLHMMVDSVKTTQAQGAKPPNLSLNLVPVWIETHLGTVLFRLLLTLVGLFGAVFSMGARAVTPFVGLLIGYSLDSVIGLVANTVGEQSSAFVAAMKQRVGGTAATS